MTQSDLPLLTRDVLTSATALQAWMTAAADGGAVALIDKEEDWTSFDVVAKLRGMLRIRRIGHAGTLDPLATGLLIVCVGRATKSVERFQDEDKTYTVTIKLGATTETDDRGSEEIPVKGALPVHAEAVAEALRSFIGTIEQIPPAYAAIKHGGRPQYDLARQGKAFTPRPRIITITDITNVTVDYPFVNCTVHCSKGTYIRSLARDVGEQLGTGGYVHALRRTQSGQLSVDSAVTLGALQTAVSESMVS